MSAALEEKIADFARWRAEMIAGIETYKSWLDANGVADIQQSLRIYDLIESLRRDRMTLAFIAEFSRGKTELINAMLFAKYRRRLLPSDVGRTTMCPTELFHDPQEEPCIRLLPIETRSRRESIAELRAKPVEWIKVQLDVDSAESMVQALRALVETKKVTKDQAMALGLFDGADIEKTTVVLSDPDQVEIPAWRHALVNYPHPLLANGLVVLDTPGLNALGTEPELTMSMIPSAHAVLFVLGMDTGVTRSDLDVWQRHIANRAPRRIAVLNKVDLAWDELKPDDEIQATIERQVAGTAATLGLPRDSVLALSAQKALLARVKGDAALLRKSGIERLEALLAAELIPAKQEILRAAVAREIGGMVDSSRQSIIAQFASSREEYRNLSELRGKNEAVAQDMIARLERDQLRYQASAEQYRSALEELEEQGSVLLASLTDEVIDYLLDTDRKFIEGAWTTAGLIKNMQGLFEHFTRETTKISAFSVKMREFVEQTYAHFHAQYGFARMVPPALNLERHALTMHGMHQTTVEFCHDPVSIMTAKHFLVRKFYDNLVAEARSIFQSTRQDVEAWLRNALSPLDTALREHQIQLGKRGESLRKIRDNLHSVDERAKFLERHMLQLKAQHDVLLRIKANMENPVAPPATATTAASARAPGAAPAAAARAA